ncbi:ABC transporter family protein [Scheffersomyces stipitis CBS 6054]|uniref:ABC transporter family protein n=1 Tax=Scheffersomyces stipitis (strain ATCC 58785 / CBS 6054 / NBRC 10063 / NRRL Y-11545) TaxID=322104 RepID=A3LWS3_PICST|nr:ABC transporter family protein [Scheffersomyces stipitis CBS 6054]ABN67689.2 ABC transporter family protein [Scheffersomyces stipitis CBS 6054]
MNAEVLAIEPHHRVSISVRNLVVSVKEKKKKTRQNSNEKELESSAANPKILDNVSFDIQAGEMMAIVGGSGSGKTTLLNTLSTRLNVENHSLDFSGYVEFSTPNGDKRIKNSYLQQSDVFLPGLTAFETLRFQADLRLPPSVSQNEKIALIESLLDTLEISHLRNTRVVSFTQRINLSGGEQRRLSLAVQLLNKPSVLFLDEPTTGLDASNALKLVQVLKKLSSPEFGVTVVMSIHQPRLEITKLFDKICLITSGGRMVYYGDLAESASYFNRISFLSKNTISSHKSSNFIDYIMDIAVKDSTTKANEELTSKRIDRLVEYWNEYSPFNSTDIFDGDGSLKDLMKVFERPKQDRISFFKEVYILTRRTFLLTYRDKLSLLALDGGSLVTAVTLGWMFYRPVHDLSGIRSLISSLYIMMEIIGFAPVFIELERLWGPDGRNFFREYKENYSSIPGFVISRRLGKVLLEDFPLAAIFAIITYFMWGLREGVGHFFVYFALTVLTSFIGMSTGMAFFAIGSDFAISSMYLNVFYQLQNNASGYFVNAATMPVYVKWTKYIAYFWYTFGALNANQLTDWEGVCTSNDQAECVEYSGNYQLSVLGYPRHWVAEPIGILIAWLAGFYVITIIGLYFKNYEMEMSKTRTNTIGEEETEEDEEEDDENISIFLDQIKLNVITSKWIHKVKVSKTILNEVTSEFRASSINAIMGPSGSGKTSLLNFLSNRLSHSSKFEYGGEISLNGGDKIARKELASISAYVTQHDNSLIGTLTVRETLYFQAQFRLPHEEHPRIPAIINKLIRVTGLIDCADTVIGSDMVKGISGGEKRRVSIAIQLLSRPKILFLDEPTSGLDSATALSILSLLKELSELSKTTVILTIHQPNEDMIAKFDNVLLMAGGGRVVYTGGSEGIDEYFRSINYPIPDGVNKGNYLLDLVSRGLDEESSESENRIATLVSAWANTEGSRQVLSKDLKRSSLDLTQYHRKKLPFSTTLMALIRRSLLNSIRSPDILFARVFQVILLAIIQTLYFAPLRNNRDGISNRLGLVQEVLNLYFVGLVNNISVYPIERNIFYQEYKDGIYGVCEFSASYLLNELPTEILPVVFFAVLIVFAIGLPRNAAMFFTMFVASFIPLNIGESLGIIVNSIFNHLGLATNLLAITISFAIFMGGTMSLQMPILFRAVNWINPLKFAVGITAKLGFKDQTFDCGLETCTLDTGDAVLYYYGLDHNLGVFFGALVACLVVYRAIAILALYTRVKYFN